MNFQDPKVRQAVYDHLKFAFESVQSVMPPRYAAHQNTKGGEDTKAMYQVADNMRIALIGQILSFTLARDYRLANSLTELKEARAGWKLEDLLL